MQDASQFPELPEAIRNIMKSSIEQAKKAFDTFIMSSEKMMSSFDTGANTGAESLKQLNEKVAQFTRQNAEANFNLALKLTEARQLSDVVELQNAHVRQQMETFSHQLEELRDLTTKAVKDTTKTATSAVQNSMSNMQGAAGTGNAGNMPGMPGPYGV